MFHHALPVLYDCKPKLYVQSFMANFICTTVLYGLVSPHPHSSPPWKKEKRIDDFFCTYVSAAFFLDSTTALTSNSMASLNVHCCW